MPIYEYKCTACCHVFDAVQGVDEGPLSICPTCHSSTLIKLISLSSFRLKGSGWYATDFKETKKKDELEEKKSKEASTAEKAPSDVKKEAKENVTKTAEGEGKTKNESSEKAS